MNLLYILTTNLILDTESGVYKKIKSQTNELALLGVQVKVMCFSANVISKQQLFEHCTVYPLNNASSYNEIIDIINENANWTNKILFRYPFASKQLLELVCAFPNEIYFEHNTFEETEVLLNQKVHFRSLPFSFSLSYLKYWFSTFIVKNTIEKRLGSEILAKAKAGICVTNEIANYEKARCKNYKTTVISNGAELNKYEENQNPVFVNTLKLFMLIGNEAKWHGIDRIALGLQNFKNKNFNILVDIYGGDGNEFKNIALPKNCSLNFLSKINKTDLNKSDKGYHICFSSLAMYRIGMKEASSLKLRDSMLMGFPIVLGYNDTDVTDNKAFNAFIHQVDNNNSIIDFQKIIDFYYKVSEIEHYQVKIKALAERTFSHNVKAQQLINFLSQN